MQQRNNEYYNNSLCPCRSTIDMWFECDVFAHVLLYQQVKLCLFVVSTRICLHHCTCPFAFTQAQLAVFVQAHAYVLFGSSAADAHVDFINTFCILLDLFVSDHAPALVVLGVALCLAGLLMSHSYMFSRHT